MKALLRFAWLAAFLAAMPGIQAAGPGRSVRAAMLPDDLCKNHYILSEPLCGDEWIEVAELNAARSSHTATLLHDGRVLVAGGSAERASSAEIYDPRTGQWTLTGALNRNRKGHTATLLANGKVLVAGAWLYWDIDLQEFVYDGTAELFDPAMGVWTPTRPLAAEQAGFTATLLPTGQVLLAGGTDRNDNPVAIAQLYDPATESWSVIPGPQVSYGHAATRLDDGRVLVAGGVGDDFWGETIAGTWIYDPWTGSWSAAGNMQVARASHTATLLADGTVLAVGGYVFQLNSPSGYSHFASIASTERFDPATGRWMLAGELALSRFDHAVTLMPDAAVLVTGGTHSFDDSPHVGYAMAVASERTPLAGNVWVLASPLNSGRSRHTATLLTDGSVLVAGGSRVNDAPLASAEIYRPGSSRVREPR